MTDGKATIYGVMDLKARSFVGPLFIKRHSAAAIRDFADVALDEKTQVNKHPEDYALYSVATVEENDDAAPQLDFRMILTAADVLAAQTPHLRPE